MQRFSLIYTQPWYIGLSVWQKGLVRTTLELYAREERLQSNFEDYSFVVFPMAKAYEGFLKHYLYTHGLISRQVYYDKHFRLGRALNPDVRPEHRDHLWLYDRIVQCVGREMARQVWDVWLTCRNQLFHYFPDQVRQLDLLTAGQAIEMIAQVIERLSKCKTDTSHLPAVGKNS